MKKQVLLALLAIASFSFMLIDPPKGLSIGDPAPDFAAYNQSGKMVHLAERVRSGKVVLIFYRGEWCPYCNRELAAFQDSLAFITEKGAQVIAVSPETQKYSTKTAEKTKASFDLITDEGGAIMHVYQVAFELDSATTKKYKTYNIDLIERNGSAGNKLPVPAVYIIGQDGKIAYRFFDSDYKNRPSVKEILTHL